jgi:predicted Ser/Thr protein kinase
MLVLTAGVVFKGTFGQVDVAVKQLQHNQSAAVSAFRREVRVLSMLQKNAFVCE